MLRNLFGGPKNKEGAGFAYLFEKFPSFSQTFCIREAVAVRDLGIEFPVYSIRKPCDEPLQDLCDCAGKVIYLPDTFSHILAEDANFRRAARKALDELKELWGSEEEKRRIYEALWLGPELKKAGVEHVHIHFAGLGARTAFWLHRLFGIRYSVTAHANDIFRDEPPERLKQIFEKASLVVTVSDFSLKFLQANYPTCRTKFFRVYNGIDTGAFTVSSLPEGRPLIVSVGRYIEKKGFRYLVEACAQLKDLDFECQIIGHGPLEGELKAQVAALGLEGKVAIAGPRSEGEIKALLGRAHLFVLPCITGSDGAMDNLPTVIMEAMAAGVPCISTALAAVPEMILDGTTGYVVPEADSAELAARMRTLLTDRGQAAGMAHLGLERARALFDLQQTSHALTELFRKHNAIHG